MELQLLLNTIRNMVKIGTNIEAKETQKGTRTLTGIMIGDKNNVFTPVVYMEYYEDLFQEKGYEAVAREMIKICQNTEVLHVNLNEITSLDYAKNNLMLCIAPARTNNGNVSFPYLDLELYFRVTIDGGTYTVTELMMGSWGITKEELLEIATNNSTYTVKSMEDILKELVEDSYDDFLEVPQEYRQTVITNELQNYGASALYNKTLLKEIADKFNDDLCIMPSSIHEIIVIPMNVIPSKENVDSMIKEINELEVRPEKRLSDHAYVFHRDTMEIEW